MLKGRWCKAKTLWAPVQLGGSGLSPVPGRVRAAGTLKRRDGLGLRKGLCVCGVRNQWVSEKKSA